MVMLHFAACCRLHRRTFTRVFYGFLTARELHYAPNAAQWPRVMRPVDRTQGEHDDLEPTDPGPRSSDVPRTGEGGRAGSTGGPRRAGAPARRHAPAG